MCFLLAWSADRGVANKQKEIEHRNAEMRRKKEMTALRGEVERIELENRGLVDVGYHIYRKRIS